WAEYDSALVVVAMLGALAVLRVRPWREVALLGALPALTLLPWTVQLAHGLDKLDVTKVSPSYPGPSPASWRDVTVPLLVGPGWGARARSSARAESTSRTPPPSAPPSRRPRRGWC